MFRYGQYCPIAKSAEILGDRWTVLIVRELLADVHRFNELHRGLPGISRSVLTERLRRLEDTGVVERRSGAGSPGYQLTAAGRDLQPVIQALGDWAATWVLNDPRPGEADPDLLMLAISRHVDFTNVPAGRVVVGFRIDVGKQRRRAYWLVLEEDDASLCLQHPGFDPDLIVRSDTRTLARIYMGWVDWNRAVRDRKVEIEGRPALIRKFPRWMTWSAFAPTVRQKRGARTRPERGS